VKDDLSKETPDANTVSFVVLAIHSKRVRDVPANKPADVPTDILDDVTLSSGTGITPIYVTRSPPGRGRTRGGEQRAAAGN